MRKLSNVALALALALGLASAASTSPARAQVAIGVSVGIAPPPLPYYDQPPLPAPGYIWTPGYWAWGGYDYYWVPGTWVLPPEPGFLWTPAYWGWGDGVYLFHVGYWGPVVGFYGGIDYGFGYFGAGYGGGYWDHDRFFYNRQVNNFGGARITNVYNRTVIDPRRNVSFNGGAGGVGARPTSAEMAAAHQRHVGPTALQSQHQRLAASVPALRASANHGRPPIAATSRPAAFRGAGVVPAAHAATLAQARGSALTGAGRANAARNPSLAQGRGQTTHAMAQARAPALAGTARANAGRNQSMARLSPHSTAALNQRSAANGRPQARSAQDYGRPASATVARSPAARMSRPEAASPRAPAAAYRAQRAMPAEPRYAARAPAASFERAMPRGGPAPVARNAGPPAQPRGGGGGGHPGGGGERGRPQH